MKGISLALTPAQVRVKLFLRACTMSILNATGIWLIAHGEYWCGVTGFLIAWNWTNATRDVNDHRVPYSRLSYAIGGGAGAILAVAFSLAMHRMHIL